MVLKFDSFVLDVEGFVLSQSGREVPLQPRALEMLIHLVINRHRLVSKEELVAGPWHGTAVTDTAIHQAMLLVRRALAETATSPRYLRTIRGKGFRFIAAVIDDAEPSAARQREDAVGIGAR